MNISLLRGSGSLVLMLAALVCTRAQCQSDQPTALTLGADIAACSSALHVGFQSCNDGVTGPEASTPFHRVDSKSGTRSGAMESRIDDFLAAYGKPPRAAVRALLDPSDDNIRALMAEQEKTLSVAGYVASRMTAIKSAESYGPGRSPLETRLSQVLGQMRIRLYQRPREGSTRETLFALAQLSRIAPSLQTGVELVGPIRSRQLQSEIGRIDPSLSVNVVAMEQIDDQALPYLRIDDLRNQSTRVLDARGVTMDQLREALVAMRSLRVTAQVVPDPGDVK